MSFGLKRGKKIGGEFRNSTFFDFFGICFAFWTMIQISEEILKNHQKYSQFRWKIEKNSKNIDDTYINIFFVLEVLVVISAVLYIPMFCSIQKLAHLPSVAQYEPQKYVKYQALLISVMKSVSYFDCFFIIIQKNLVHVSTCFLWCWFFAPVNERVCMSQAYKAFI